MTTTLKASRLLARAACLAVNSRWSAAGLADATITSTVGWNRTMMPESAHKAVPLSAEL